MKVGGRWHEYIWQIGQNRLIIEIHSENARIAAKRFQVMPVKERFARPLTPDELAFVKASTEHLYNALDAAPASGVSNHSDAPSSVPQPVDDPEVLSFVERIIKVKSALARAQRILVITGAGISAESGIPTFRSEGGWWRSHNPEELATLKSFEADPQKVWEWYDYRRKSIAAAAPNLAHEALAAWERSGKHVAIITQNVDDLHERAGSSEVIHIHGSIWEVVCQKDGTVIEDRRTPLNEIPPFCSCGGLLRPNVVWFDEELPIDECKKIDSLFREGSFDVALVIGTEATFDYVRGYATEARRQGALLVEINLKPTELTDSVDIHLTGKAGEILHLLS